MENQRSLNSTLKLIATIAVTAIAGVSSAHAGVIELNPSGTGFAGAIPVSSGINAHGSGFVAMGPDLSNPANLIFSETGAYQLTKADGISPIGTHDITLTYSVVGTLELQTGALNFTAGSFNLYSDPTFNFGTTNSNPSVIFGANDGTLIASFLISSGRGMPNNTVHLNGDATTGSIRSGYFFSSTGEDLSLTGNLQFAVDIGNMVVSPTANEISEIICKTSAYPVPGCGAGDYANTPYYFAVRDGGTVNLSSTIPEPGSMALAFAGLMGLGLSSRRAKNSSRQKDFT